MPDREKKKFSWICLLLIILALVAGFFVGRCTECPEPPPCPPCPDINCPEPPPCPEQPPCPECPPIVESNGWIHGDTLKSLICGDNSKYF